MSRASRGLQAMVRIKGPGSLTNVDNERVSTEFGKSPQSRWTRAIASRRPDAHCECPMSPPSDPSISHVSRMYLAHAPSPRPDPASPQRGGQICESDTGRPHRPLEMRRPSRLIAREGPLPRALAHPRRRRELSALTSFATFGWAARAAHRSCSRAELSCGCDDGAAPALVARAWRRQPAA